VAIPLPPSHSIYNTYGCQEPAWNRHTRTQWRGSMLACPWLSVRVPRVMPVVSLESCDRFIHEFMNAQGGSSTSPLLSWYTCCRSQWRKLRTNVQEDKMTSRLRQAYSEPTTTGTARRRALKARKAHDMNYFLSDVSSLSSLGVTEGELPDSVGQEIN